MSVSSFQGEPVQVEARLMFDGQIQPTAVIWRSNQHAVTAVGRQWSEQERGQPLRCVLVRLANGPTLELALYTADWLWRVRQIHELPARA